MKSKKELGILILSVMSALGLCGFIVFAGGQISNSKFSDLSRAVFHVS